MNKSIPILMFCIIINLVGVLAITENNILIGQKDNCINLPQVCPNCTYVNITSIILPDLSIMNIDETMTKTGTSYNYSFCNTSQIGNYVYCNIGDVDGVNTVVCNNFQINPQGYTTTTGQGIIYTVGTFIVFCMFLISLYFAIAIPYNNPTNDFGHVLAIDYKKYLKIGMWVVSYLILIFLFFIGKGMSYAFLNSTELYGFFNVGASILLAGVAPILILTGVLVIFARITDKEIQQILERGISPR